VKLEKITEGRDRWYDDACGTAHALELVGERWSLLIVRELMFGPRRFGELRAALPGISANILTVRLASLEAAGVVERRKLPPPASVQVYGLTPWGYEAEEPIKVLGRWAARSPDHDPSLPLSAASLMLSFRTMFDPGRAEGLDARIGFVLGGESFLVRVGEGVLTVTRGELDQAEAVVTATPEGVAGVVYGPAPLDTLDVQGDRALVERFVRLFVLPPKAPAPAP
jgi:DNA-binding HxlR family transcriptional regulator